MLIHWIDDIVLNTEYRKYEVVDTQLDMVRHMHAIELEINPTKCSEAIIEISKNYVIGVTFAVDPVKNKLSDIVVQLRFWELN